MKTIAIVQARFGSSRLPGKVLEDIGPCTALEHVVKRVQSAVPTVVVAVPNTPRDGRVFSLAREKLRVGAYMFDGEETDVLARYAACAREYGAEVIVRVTSDCPFVDPGMIGLVVALQEHSGANYASNLPEVPQVDGLDCEVFTAEILELANAHASSPYDREHVTPWIRRAAAGRLTLVQDLPLPGVRRHRWTLDTPEDLAWMRMVAEKINTAPPESLTLPLCSLLSEHPELSRYTEAESFE